MAGLDLRNVPILHERALVPVALRAIDRGGTVVYGGIHMSDIPGFPYAALWGERVLRSVANLTRSDATAFLALAPEVPVKCARSPIRWPRRTTRSPTFARAG